MNGKNSFQNLLDVINVTKIFRYGIIGFKFKALDNVSVSLEGGSTVLTIIGESGSGKTTLAKTILGIHRPDEGRILYRGLDVHRLRGRELYIFLKEVQPIFQNPYESFNPLKKVHIYLYETVKNLLGINDEIDASKYISEALERVGLRLSDVRGKYPHEFSGGELQRIAIARAILSKPKLLIADEPVSMLDASLRVSILNILKELKKEMNTSIIYITHDISTASYIGDNVAVMYRGTIVEKGSLRNTIKKPLHPYTQLLIESIPIPNKQQKTKWLTPLPLSATIEEKEFLAKGCKFAPRCPYAEKKCFELRPPEIEIESKRYVSCWLYQK